MQVASESDSGMSHTKESDSGMSHTKDMGDEGHEGKVHVQKRAGEARGNRGSAIRGRHESRQDSDRGGLRLPGLGGAKDLSSAAKALASLTSKAHSSSEDDSDDDRDDDSNSDSDHVSHRGTGDLRGERHVLGRAKRSDNDDDWLNFGKEAHTLHAALSSRGLEDRGAGDLHQELTRGKADFLETSSLDLTWIQEAALLSCKLLVISFVTGPSCGHRLIALNHCLVHLSGLHSKGAGGGDDADSVFSMNVDGDADSSSSSSLGSNDDGDDSSSSGENALHSALGQRDDSGSEHADDDSGGQHADWVRAP